MLTPKNKALLKRLANPLEPSLTIGKGAIDDAIIAVVDKALSAHELIKVRVLTVQEKTRSDAALLLAEKTHSEVVQVVGRIVILYRARESNPTIVLL